ncbi:MAG: hypothetical protein WCE78_21415 [Pseudonocardiaceae bacterium]
MVIAPVSATGPSRAPDPRLAAGRARNPRRWAPGGQPASTSPEEVCADAR